MMKVVPFISPFFVVIFFVQIVSASTDDNLKIFSEKSVVLFNSFPNDVMRQIANATAQLYTNNVENLKQLVYLKQASQKWNSTIIINSESVFGWCLISPMSYAFLTGNLRAVSRLVISKGQSFLFEKKGQKKPYEYAFYSVVFQPTMSFILALKPKCRVYDDHPLYDKACYFQGPIDETTDKILGSLNACNADFVNKQLSLLQEMPLPILQHFFYKLAYKNQTEKIGVLARWFFKFKNNEFLKKNHIESVEFLDLFFKSYFEKLLFSEIKYNWGTRNVFWLNQGNGTLLNLLKIFSIDLNKACNKKGTPLLIAAILNNNVYMIDLLLSKTYNASVNQVGLTGKPPLYYAIKNTFELTIKRLLNHKDIDADWVNPKNGNTFFHYLAKRYCIGGPMENLLISRLKNPNLVSKKNNAGETYQEVERKKY